ncbi:hypothetical protein HYH03_008069 [Edaphochlamys debaryana]|uniref:Ubiquitin-like domain-containing protein n=1 Tax=Edaphochlamys debaryana TaxID=47281 RepID=A0A835Y389_9CHLO|nr:hypothetical protein HYH03_008069 [Edaphochlamys debaryana]|eukprot:KAG2493853.1 hypothetical protein HYH03_008069 [Edaphochlamys debaryana]
MPPESRRERGAGGGGGSASGAAASSGAAAASLLPADLRAAHRELPRFADALVPPVGKGAPGHCSRLSPMKKHELNICLTRLQLPLDALPVLSAPHAAAVAELLSQEPATAAALLTLQAAALRPNADDGPECLGIMAGRMAATTVACTFLAKAAPLPPSRHALPVLRFARAMLRAQPFHGISRLLAEVAAALEAGRAGGGGNGGGGGAGPSRGGSISGSGTGSSSGGGRRSGGGAGHSNGGSGAGSSSGGGFSSGGGAGHSNGGGAGSRSGGGAAASSGGGAGLALTPAYWADLILGGSIAAAHYLLGLESDAAEEADSPPPSGRADRSLGDGGRAAERAACLEEFARGLAESGFLEHAMRLTLASGPARLIWAPPPSPEYAAARSTSPAAAAHLRSTLSGRCVQTAVLVYGVGTLRVADRGPSYGLPAELQTAGLALMGKDDDGGRGLDPIALQLLLHQLASGSTLPPPGPGASLELALRVGRVALGTAAARIRRKTLESLDSNGLRPPELAMPLTLGISEAVRLAAGALSCGRRLLPRQRPSPRLEAQMAEWWRLAVLAATFGVREPEGSLRQRWGLVTEPLIAVWPDGRLDLDALPPAAPPKLAAALAGGLLLTLCTFITSASPPDLPAVFMACEEGRSDGRGFALFLVPLLAYGDLGVCCKLLAALGRLGMAGASGGSAGAAGSAPGHGPRDATGPYMRASKVFFREAAAAILRCNGLADMPAGGSGGAAAAVPASSAAAGQPAATTTGSSAAVAGASATSSSTASAAGLVQGAARMLGEDFGLSLGLEARAGSAATKVPAAAAGAASVRSIAGVGAGSSAAAPAPEPDGADTASAAAAAPAPDGAGCSTATAAGSRQPATPTAEAAAAVSEAVEAPPPHLLQFRQLYGLAVGVWGVASEFGSPGSQGIAPSTADVAAARVAHAVAATSASSSSSASASGSASAELAQALSRQLAAERGGSGRAAALRWSGRGGSGTGRAQDGSEVQFKIKKTTKLEKVFNAYAQKKGMDVKELRFVADGNVLGTELTAGDAGLEDGDVIDAMVTQVGGCR